MAELIITYITISLIWLLTQDTAWVKAHPMIETGVFWSLLLLLVIWVWAVNVKEGA